MLITRHTRKGTVQPFFADFLPDFKRQATSGFAIVRGDEQMLNFSISVLSLVQNSADGSLWPHHRKAAGRYAQCRRTDTVLRTLALLLATHSRATPKQAKEPKIRVGYSNSIIMEKDKIVLATLDNGRHLTVADIKLLIERNDRKALADFIYNRLYGRYIKPYDYDSDAYKQNYKNGFAIMGSNCLLIESYASFTEAKFRKTKDLSRQCFGHFFTTEKRFKEFAEGGRQKDGTISTKKQGGTPNEFYDNVRCGILHNGETRNGWTISRNPKKPLFNKVTKEINAVKFANNMKAILKSYKFKLESTNQPDNELWPTFLNRLNDLIKTV